MSKKVAIGADHAGFKLKESLKVFLKHHRYQVVDKGNIKYDPTDDYPDYAAKVARAVTKDVKGILVCGSAEGICIAANKIKGIRAVAVWNLENAKLSREHNDANVLCLSGGGMLKPTGGLPIKKAEQITLTWLKTEFSNEPRHVRRINKIKKLEK
ncbi:RpiB/LacA/LacB family sugar-phosphate isomerase [Candidatus Woesearchaeota archaeon]|nr:RpiB/LacA/LacB family sugar-phosphate isomerase [Candidatus Woesearchaeota archaeon]